MVRLLATVGLLVLCDATPKGDLFEPLLARACGAMSISRVQVAALQISSDARRLVVLGQDQTLAVWDLRTRREIRTVPAAFRAGRISINRTGTRAAGTGINGRSVRIIDLDRGEEIALFADTWNLPGGFDLSPDGSMIALLKTDQSVRVIEVPGGEEKLQLVPPGLGQAGQVSWSPDGARILCYGLDQQMRVFGAARGEELATFGVPGRTAPFLGFTPDSRKIAYIGQDWTIRLLDLTGREILHIGDPTPGTRSVAISPDGRYVAAGNPGGTLRVWEVASGRKVREIEAGQGPLGDVGFTTDGRFLLSAGQDGTVRLWGSAGPPQGLPKPGPRTGKAGFLGITGSETEDGEPGVAIDTVMAGTAAEKAGFQAGDVILKVAGTTTDTFETLRTLVGGLKEGDEVEITFQRAGAEKKAKVKLGARPENP